MQGHQTPEGEVSLGGTWSHPSSWFLVDRMEVLALLFIFSGVQLGILCGAPPFFSFHRGCTWRNAQPPNVQWLVQKINSTVP